MGKENCESLVLTRFYGVAVHNQICDTEEQVNVGIEGDLHVDLLDAILGHVQRQAVVTIDDQVCCYRCKTSGAELVIREIYVLDVKTSTAGAVA